MKTNINAVVVQLTFFIIGFLKCWCQEGIKKVYQFTRIYISLGRV